MARELTEIGFDYLISTIREQPVIPPAGMNVEMLQGWIDGYAEAQQAVIDVINDYREGKE